jgi:hypothetical protein
MALLQSGTRIYGNATIDTNLSINGNTVSTSNNTGALKVAGGIGVVGNIFSSGNITAENANLGNLVSASYFSGSGNLLSNIQASNITGFIANANYASYTGNVVTAAQPNITSLGTLTRLSISGQITGNLEPVLGNTYDLGTSANNWRNLYLSGNTISLGGTTITGDSITGISVTSLSAAGGITLGGSTITGGASGISVVSLTSGDTTINGNLTVNGTFEYANVTSFRVKDTIIEQGGNVTGSALTTNDGFDRGQLLHYYVAGTTNAPVDAFMGWKNASGEFIFASNVAESSGNITINTYGNIRSGNANLGNLVSASYFSGSGNLLSNIQGSNVNGAVANATYAANANYAAYAGNATTADSATTAGTVTVSSQPNITSIGSLTTLVVTGNITTGNASLGNLATANYLTVNNNANIAGNLTTGNANLGNLVIANYVTVNNNANIAGNLTTGNANLGNLATANYITVNNNANIAGNLTTRNANLGNSVTANYIVAANSITANYFVGDGGNLSNINTAGLLSGVKPFVTSNIDSVVAGSTIVVVADYANTTYPGGLFTITQLGPVTLTTTDIWSSGTATKNAYANYLASSINTQNINITLSLSNATFSVKSSDSITIGGSTITGANLVGLNITGNGTYTIPNTYFSSSVQTTTTSAVSVSLTTSRGVYSSTGTSLTATQPIAYTVNSISGSFPASTVPYWNLNQTFNWNVSVTGTTSAGNLTYSGGAINTTSLTTTGASSGSSASINSTVNYTVVTTDYTGAGAYGYGSRTIPNTVTGTVTAATMYYPLFYKITSSSSAPTFTSSDSYLTHDYVLGDGATTSSTPSQYLWIAIPGAGSHTFAYTFLGTTVGQTPSATSSQTISGYNYNIYGFTNFSAATLLYTVT